MRQTQIPAESPYSLENVSQYNRWRDHRISHAPQDIADLIVEIKNPLAISISEYEAMVIRLQRSNMVIYAGPTGDNPDKEIPRQLGTRFGLSRLDNNWGADDDGITSLKVNRENGRNRYIPYTNHAINWHTDGYYNTQENQIRGLMLHCVHPAATGGQNGLIDHELAYIHLRDQNPEWIEALMAPDAMTIPGNRVDGQEVRPDRSGPVFSLDSKGHLHMRYTARQRNIVWKEDRLVLEAVAALRVFCESDSPWIFRGTLQSGQGLISNNVLHDRSGFNDSDALSRLLYRLRYFDRVDNS